MVSPVRRLAPLPPKGASALGRPRSAHLGLTGLIGLVFAGFGTTTFGAVLDGATAYNSRTSASLACALLLDLSSTIARSYSAPASRVYTSPRFSWAIP